LDINLNEVIIIKEEFIRLEINIPCSGINDLIDKIKYSALEVVSKMNDSSENNTKLTEIITDKNIELQLFTVKEVAKKLRVNTNAVYELIKSGHLSALKLGMLKITSTELERFFKYSEGKDFTDLNKVKELQPDK
jgi:excisionase family DNA binding protein